MRILIFRKCVAELTPAVHQRSGEKLSTLLRRRIMLLNRPHDEGTNGSARFLCLRPQPLMQRVRNVDCGSNWHDIIMSQATDVRLSPERHEIREIRIVFSLPSSSEECKARPDVLSLRVRLLSADLRIPIRRRIGEELTLPAEVAHRFFIDFDAQARPRRNGDVTLNHEVPFVG
jgi:hypothetical protein